MLRFCCRTHFFLFASYIWSTCGAAITAIQSAPLAYAVLHTAWQLERASGLRCCIYITANNSHVPLASGIGYNNQLARLASSFLTRLMRNTAACFPICSTAVSQSWQYGMTGMRYRVLSAKFCWAETDSSTASCNAEACTDDKLCMDGHGTKEEKCTSYVY